MNRSINNKLRAGVIGVGYLGEFHAEKYARMDAVDLVGVVDVNKTRAEEIAGKFGTQAYVNYQDLLGLVDIVSIVVPTPQHFPVAIDFIENRVDLLIEKPITTTLQEADELLELAESKGVIIQVGHLERFNPAVVALQGIIVDPMFIESHRISFYKERGSEISVVLDLMIHDIDIISNFVNSDIKNLHASGVPVISDHVDIANARIEFANGCIANITASRIALKNERKVRLFQRDAYVSVDFANHSITIIRKGSQDKKGPIPGMEIQQVDFSQSDALNDELISFVKSIQKREVPKVTGQMGRDALKIALTAMEQIKNANSRLLGL